MDGRKLLSSLSFTHSAYVCKMDLLLYVPWRRMRKALFGTALTRSTDGRMDGGCAGPCKVSFLRPSVSRKPRGEKVHFFSLSTKKSRLDRFGHKIKSRCSLKPSLLLKLLTLLTPKKTHTPKNQTNIESNHCRLLS